MIREYVKLATIYHLLNDVRTAVLRDLGSIRIGNDWINVRRGEEVSIPLWLADILESRGSVEIKEQKLSDVDISKYLLIERGLKSSEFQKLKPSFYFEIKTLLKRMKERGSEHIETYIMRLARTEADVKDLIRIRMRKLVQIALLSKKPEEYMPLVLIEERILLNELIKDIRGWFEEVSRFA